MTDQPELQEALPLVDYKIRLLDASLPPKEIARLKKGIKHVHDQCSLPSDLRQALDIEPSKRSPEVTSRLAAYSQTGWLFGDPPPKGDYRYLVMETPDGQVVGYSRLLISLGEDVDDEFVWTDDNARAICAGPHIEIDEAAVLPQVRKTRNFSHQSPSVQLIKESERYAKDHGYTSIMGWIVTDDLPDRPSTVLHQMLGYKRGGTVDSFSEYAHATCFYKTF